MSRTRLAATTALLSLLIIAVIATAACSGGSTASTNATTTPDAATDATANPAVTPNTMATAGPDAMASPDPTEPPDPQQALFDQGKLLFEVTAGGLGCAFCHGLDGRGKAEFATPPNRGATEELIWDALQTRPQMSFITLTDQELKAVSTYLQWLATQP